MLLQHVAQHGGMVIYLFQVQSCTRWWQSCDVSFTCSLQLCDVSFICSLQLCDVSFICSLQEGRGTGIAAKIRAYFMQTMAECDTVEGLGFGVWGLGFGVWSLGLRVLCQGFVLHKGRRDMCCSRARARLA